MREIKFRAWHKLRKEMYNVSGLAKNMIWSHGTTEGHNLSSISDVFLMQFTGVKDKNGKEVFEGDVLRTIGFYDRGKPYYLYHEVIFSDLYHMWYCVSLPKVPAESRGNNFLYAYAKREFEIIGNIYENPKLLKPKKQLT